MSKFLTYLREYSKELNLTFERIRKTVSDSDVKGGANERTVASFIEVHTSARFYCY